MRGEGLGKRIGAKEVPFLSTWLGWRLEVPWLFTMESEASSTPSQTKLPRPDAALQYESPGLTIDAQKVKIPKYTRC